MCQPPSKPSPIARRLSYRPPDAKADEVITQDLIVGLAGPIVILGDPGLGKSVLTEELGSKPGNTFVRAGTFVRAHDPKRFAPGPSGRLVIDGLDEIASATPGGGIHDVLRQLSALGNPSFILSSREADWAGAAARVQIEDDYGEAALLLRLQPFDRDDAAAYLKGNFPSADGQAVLNHLADHGLEEIYRNPLTLRMIGEVASAEETLPRTRSALLERACELMLVEKNQRHQADPHTQYTVDTLLMGAGAIAASLLLCNRLSVTAVGLASASSETLPLMAVTCLSKATAAGEALKTRLFQADGENRFAPIHRVIAEFLAARWLAAVIEQGASTRRVLSLLTLGGGVPTSLRGVNAWLAHFSPILAPDCIAADPYAVLRYGDPETMPTDQARLLLQALSRLAGSDPFFREGEVAQHAAAGLLRVDLKDQVLALIIDERANGLLSHLLLEGLDKSPLLSVIESEIENILLNTDASAAARVRALTALSDGGRLTAPQWLVEELLARGDRQSNRSAFRILKYGRIDSVIPWTAVRALLAAAEITVSSILRNDEDNGPALHIRADTFDKVEEPFIRAFLEDLTDCAEPLMSDVDRPDREPVANIVRLALARLLTIDQNLDANDVWRWLSWTGGYNAFNKTPHERLRDSLAGNDRIVRAIQLAVVVETPLTDLRYEAIIRLRQASSALRIDDARLVDLMGAYAARAGAALDLERLSKLRFLA